MAKENQSNNKVELNETEGAERVIRTVCFKANPESECELRVHFSFLNEAFFAAMKRAKLEGFEQTFASGFYYTGDAAAFGASEGDATEWIWMPIETEADCRFLFSAKPWEESGMSPAVQKKTAKKLNEEFEQFRKEMLS